MPELVALQARLPQFETPVESQAKVLQLRQLMNADQVAGMDMQQRRQALADDAAVRQAYAENTDPSAQLQALAKISPKAYHAELKSRQEADKNASEVDYKKAQARAEQLKAAHSALDAAGQVMGYVMKNPTAAAAHSALDTLERYGFYSAQDIAKYREIANRGNADEIRQLAEQGYRGALSVKDQLPKIETRNIGGTTETDAFDPVTGARRNIASVRNTQSPDSIAAQATARRGQDISRENSRLDRTQRQQQGEAPTYDQERGIVVDRRSGTARQVLDSQGQPLQSGKAMTEFQGKSASFADRAAEANRLLGGLKYSPAAINSKNAVEGVPLIGGALGAATNTLALSAQDQQAEQAQRDFINAVLRQESGAAIGASEFDNARKQYFPQPGDSQEVVRQKAANRKTAINGLQRSAGPSYKAPKNIPAAGAVEDGYRFKGGDAADPNNWEKI
jgi:hypothetical protein